MTVHPSAVIVKDHAVRGGRSRARGPTKRVAIRAPGSIKVAASTRLAGSIRVDAPIRAPGRIGRRAIRTGARTPVPAQTRMAELTRPVGSSPAHAATRVAVAPIKADASTRVHRVDALIKKVGRTKALRATISATA